jgi:putative transposase
MKKSRFSEERIIAILKEHAAGIPVAELCRKHGISDATFITGDPATAGWQYRTPVG